MIAWATVLLKEQWAVVSWVKDASTNTMTINAFVNRDSPAKTVRLVPYIVVSQTNIIIIINDYVEIDE